MLALMMKLVALYYIVTFVKRGYLICCLLACKPRQVVQAICASSINNNPINPNIKPAEAPFCVPQVLVQRCS